MQDKFDARANDTMFKGAIQGAVPVAVAETAEFLFDSNARLEAFR